MKHTLCYYVLSIFKHFMMKMFTIISSVLLFTMTTMPLFGFNFRHVVVGILCMGRDVLPSVPCS